MRIAWTVMLFILPGASLVGCTDASAPGVVGESTASGGIMVGSSSETSAKLDMGGGVSGFDIGSDPTNAEGGTGCTEVEVTVQPVIPTIVLLVDQSGSMEYDFAGQTRWDALYETLMGPGAIVMALDSSVRFGFTLYSSVDGLEGGMCPMLTEVAPALGNYAAIDAVYAAADPLDETPTGESVALVAQALAAVTEPGPKAIVLATDGEPDTCAEPNPQEGQPQSITAVQNAFADGISTFVISVGTEVAEEHLQDVANAGVGKPPDDANPAPFYVALDADDLVNAFDAIIGGLGSCELPIDAIVELEKACEGTLLLDGIALECPIEWEMQGESTIVLLGDACDTWQDGRMHAIEASWPCDAVSIP